MKTIKFKTYALLILVLLVNVSFAQTISSTDAIEDLKEYKRLLETESSYYTLSDYDFDKQFEILEKRFKSKDSIDLRVLLVEIGRIQSKIVDRHASIKSKTLRAKDEKVYNLKFPFALAPLGNKVLALKRNKDKSYDYYNSDYKYLSSIDGMPIEEFIKKYAFRRDLSPMAAKNKSSLKDLRDIGELYYNNGEFDKRTIEIKLTDGKNSKKVKMELVDKRHKWRDNAVFKKQVECYMNVMRKKDYSSMTKYLDDSIAYYYIPSMYSYSKTEGLETYLEKSFDRFKDAKALIIDIRGNGGGRREILNTFAKHIVQPENSPWVANVAMVRSDQSLDEDISSMQARYLFNYYSDTFSDTDKGAIDKFKNEFTTESKIDSSKFSTQFYMLLKSGKSPIKCPVYILVNEDCFSAASVFTSAFKGLKNVKIVGTTTNGSSGRSRKFYLKNSKIRVKLSTMLSFQRNGKTLDGNGTAPDIIIDRDEEQTLGKRDSQLEKLIEIIKSK